MPSNPPKLLGKSRTPRFSDGDAVECARRGEVRILGLSSAPIPWPLGQRLPKGRKRSLLLDGALAEAVRRELSEAVAYWFGVSDQTVTVWRKAALPTLAAPAAREERGRRGWDARRQARPVSR
jgi:hypothetical protein